MNSKKFKFLFFIYIHQIFANITIFSDNQNELKSYGTEVSLCQYSVYCRLRSNPELISRRKVARAATSCNVIVEKTEEKKEMTSFFNTIVEAFTKRNAPARVPGDEPVKSEKPSLQPEESFSVTYKEEVVLGAINSLGSSFTHNDVLKNIKSRELDHLFKLDSNWKETWAIMQELVKKNVLAKEGRHYTKTGE